MRRTSRETPPRSMFPWGPGMVIPARRSASRSLSTTGLAEGPPGADRAPRRRVRGRRRCALRCYSERFVRWQDHADCRIARGCHHSFRVRRPQSSMARVADWREHFQSGCHQSHLKYSASGSGADRPGGAIQTAALKFAGDAGNPRLQWIRYKRRVSPMIRKVPQIDWRKKMLTLNDPTLFRQQCLIGGQWVDADDNRTIPVMIRRDWGSRQRPGHGRRRNPPRHRGGA